MTITIATPTVTVEGSKIRAISKITANEDVQFTVWATKVMLASSTDTSTAVNIGRHDGTQFVKSTVSTMTGASSSIVGQFNDLSDVMPPGTYKVWTTTRLNGSQYFTSSANVTVTIESPDTSTPFAFGATGATNSTVRSTLSPGSNDVQAINTAIQSASSAGGGIVKLQAGTYTINGRIVMRSNVKLEGTKPATGAPTTILKAGTSFLSNPMYGGYSIITSAFNNENMTVANILADQSGDTLNGNVSGRLSAYLVEFRACANVVFDGIYTRNPFTYSIVLADCETFGVRNCNVLSQTSGKYDQLDGIHILQSNYGDVVDNYVDNGNAGVNGDGDDGLVAHTIGSICHDVNYRNNWVRGGRHGHGLQLAGGSYDIYNIVIEGNTFVGTSTPRGVRFGYYGTQGSKINNITINGNIFTSCTQYAVSLTDGPHTNCKVTNNDSTNSGGYFINTSGAGNTLSNNI